ncbi:hypothetical protein Poli38472_008336 [Pythium oligandrum]|uniref:AB hydrolase-1 domain-containing protein n=1 Tax=Pythium oligandrum TaxID=41045 RepID=A0A8K1CLG1_PYTOL|nr:hypothetical protein Poli38472_008336 [Pythium oligandrum]|eukprot:TMW65694.1 hypothetical protein Poli38472_008336 [Pythium oligandrum]
MPSMVVPEGEAQDAQHEGAPSTASLAQQLWMPWRLIVMNPVMTAGVYLAVNLVFIVVWLVISTLVGILTFPGFCLLIVVGTAWGVRQVTVLLSFPGQLQLVTRDGEHTFSRLTKRRLTMVLDAAQDLARLLGTRDHAAAANPSAMRMRFLQMHQNFVFSFETLLIPLVQALEYVKQDGKLGPNGERLLMALQDLVAFQKTDLTKACAELVNATSKDFEPRRQALFLSTSVPPPTGLKKLVALSSPHKPPASPANSDGVLVKQLLEKAQCIRHLLPLIGRANGANVKKDISWIAQELFRRKTKEVDFITTLDLMRADLANRFHGEQIWIPGYGGHQIDSILLPARSGLSGDRPTMIVGNPNGGLYEFHHFQMEWAKFYTDLDCNVLLFNYRGYGRNAGAPSPWAHNQDALAIVEYLKTKRGIKKIGVHGESIGGLVAAFLGKESAAIDVMIADRTFASLPALAQRLVASWAGNVVRWLTWWETDSAANYLATQCPKLICSDPDDEIIADAASLKSGVALRVELGDEMLDVPGAIPLEDEDPSPWTSLTSALGSRCRRLLGDSGRVRRVSEADLRPEQGAPMSEASIRRFSEAALSLGRRAMRYAGRREKVLAPSKRGATTDPSHVEISVDGQQQDEQDRMLTTENLNFPEELLAMVWMQVACLDGYCGQCFLQAAESGGYDRIRAWTASMLTWGGLLSPAKRSQPTLPAFERHGIQIRPLTILHVQTELRAIVEQHPSVKFDHDIGFIILMIDYLFDTLQRRWRKQDQELKQRIGVVDPKSSPTMESSPDRDAKPSLGQLLTLHCGHNRNFAEHEKAALVEFLRSVKFLPKV